MPPRQKDEKPSLEVVTLSDMFLKVHGHLAPATLLYHWIPVVDTPSIRLHDIYNYSVALKENSYQFHPDAPLSLEGSDYSANYAEVFLLHVTYNAYLVLKALNDTRRGSRTERPEDHSEEQDPVQRARWKRYSRIWILKVPRSRKYALHDESYWAENLILV